MSIWAVVPVKALSESKSRLAEVLTPEQRIELSREMLAHTLEVLSQISQIEGTLVISPDEEVLALAEAAGAHPAQENGPPQLNQALNQATALAIEAEAQALLVLPADLPTIEPADVSALVQQVGDPPVLVIAPDLRRTGTNALLTAPVGALQYAFGPDSFLRHVRQAEYFDFRIEVVDLPALNLDLDIPEDLAIYRERSTLIKE